MTWTDALSRAAELLLALFLGGVLVAFLTAAFGLILLAIRRRWYRWYHARQWSQIDRLSMEAIARLERLERRS